MPDGLSTDVPGSADPPPLRRRVRIEIDDELRSQGDELALAHVRSEVEDLYRLFATLYSPGRGAAFVIDAEIRRPAT